MTVHPHNTGGAAAPQPSQDLPCRNGGRFFKKGENSGYVVEISEFFKLATNSNFFKNTQQQTTVGQN